MPKQVYLAGPDVFLPDAPARGAAMKVICARHGLAGISPLDDPSAPPPAGWPEWQRIAAANEAHIRRADALIAHLTPFRGAGADAGTVFELGYMRALGRPVFGWANVAEGLAERVARLPADGLAVEPFGLFENLMIEAAIAASGGRLITRAVAPESIWRDLAAFERCVRLVAETVG